MLVEGSCGDLSLFYKNVHILCFLPSLCLSSVFLNQVSKGSDMARGDDAGSLKTVVVEWVDKAFGVSAPLLRPKYKEGRGVENDYCGKLLCPAEFDWDNVM